MLNARFFDSAFRQCLCGLGCWALLSAAPAQAQYNADWTRHFRIGTLVGWNISADFKTTGQLTVAPQAGVYDDGYVHPSPAAAAAGSDYTSNWGFENASQISGQSLIMHQTTSFNASAQNARQEDSPYVGMELAYGGNLWYWRRFRFGWEFGFGFLPINIADHALGSGTVTRNVYAFDTGGIAAYLPAGYHGTAHGGPPIHSTPQQLPSETIPATVNGSQTLDVFLYAFRLGPSMYWDFNRYLGMSLGVGPALGLVSGDLKTDERIGTTLAEGSSTSVPYRGSVGASDIVYGGYVSASLMYHTVQGGDVYLGAQYMPLSDARIGGANRQARLKLGGGLYVSAGFNWPF